MADGPPVASADGSSPASHGDTREGFLFALGAYLIWGVMPIYMKAVSHFPAAEVVANRVLWSVPVAGIVLIALGRTADFRAAIRNPNVLMMAAVTASVFSLNWGIYVWAIAADRTVETALGYYINPLVSILLGTVLLGERLARAQMVAVGLASVGVAIMSYAVGGVPWVSLALAVSFAAYGFLRKTLPIGPSQGFLLEVLILTLPALIYIVWLQLKGGGHFRLSTPSDMFLLMWAGPITAVPLILYAFGAKLLRITTLGIMQYVAPTLIFLVAIFIFHEPFDLIRGIAFAFIWAALALYSWTLLRGRNRL